MSAFTADENKELIQARLSEIAALGRAIRKEREGRIDPKPFRLARRRPSQVELLREKRSTLAHIGRLLGQVAGFAPPV